MLIEQAAYASRWRGICPGAKGLLALAGLLAAFLAPGPLGSATLAGLLALLTCLGAGTPPALYLRVAAPAVGFLALSSLSLLFSIGPDAAGNLHWQFAPDAMPRIEQVAGRALTALAALLLLVLTTPLPDLVALLRRLCLPEVLLDLMVLSYRMLFVFTDALHDTLTAQRARLGYISTRHSLRSLSLVAANLAVQVWLRAQALQTAALARNGDGPLRFLPPQFAHPRRDLALAGLGGSLLIGLSLGLPA